MKGLIACSRASSSSCQRLHAIVNVDFFQMLSNKEFIFGYMDVVYE